MSLYQDASLAMIPSAVKDGKLYSIKPTDGSGDFTFSRGSNLAATRVDVNGLIEKGRENLLLQSNSFSVVTWNKSSSTILGGQSGYDGSTDAWLLSQDGGAGYVEQAISQSGVYTLSVYAKAEIYDWVRLRINTTGTTQNAYFNLSGSGSIGGSGVGVHKTIASIGGGWYKCSITSASQSTSIRIYPAFGDGDISGTSGNIYIQDAQLEFGLVATDYIETTTTTEVAGITEDLPRLDYSGSCPSLLLEPTRTNSITQSEFFDSSDWTTLSNGETIVNNSVISPDGTLNASTLEGDGTDTNVYIRQDVTLTTSVDYTFSIFAKKGTNDFLAVSAEGFAGATNTLLIFDLNNSIVTTGTGDIEDYGNGWLRCSYTIAISTDGVGRFLVYPAYNGVTRAFPTSGDANGQNIYIYGAMLESGGYSSSYIPTYGSQVTRSEDFCDSAGNTSIFNSNQGVLYAEMSCPENSDNTFAISLSDGSSTNRIFLSLQSPESTYRAYATSALGSSDISFTGVNVNAMSKVAVRYSSTDFSLWVNGIQRATSTYNGMAENTLNELAFDRNGAGQLPFYGNINEVLVFKTALTDSECIALTTL